MSETTLEIANRIGTSEDKMIEILIALQMQSKFNYLNRDAIKDVADLLKVSETKVYGVASFYSMLSTVKRGINVIQVCNSTPCYIRDGQNIVKIFEDILGIAMGGTTPDEMFSLEYTSCLGACDEAPAASINGKTYGNLDRGKIFNILASIKRGEEI